MLDSQYPHVNPGPPRPSQIITPSSLLRHSGRERFEVQGAGAVLIRVSAGDTITITNAEGGQRCELVAADVKGRIDAGVIGVAANSDATGLKALLVSGAGSGLGMGSGLGGLRLGIERRGIDLAQAGAVALFDRETPAGTEESFTVTREGTVIIAAPGMAMDPGGQDTATPLVEVVQRSTLVQMTGHDLADPLADPVLDLRVKSATAQAYFVKAGDHIQIIDVDGRQCTDFQCFSARKLDLGIEHALDVTTSRTLMGHAYSMPGLHSKYYDQDFLPLVEVVQDTVGRHDAFAMACASKYYDDIGYPGHVNCSDNFNGALQRHGVGARAGWMAVNLFFNTAIDRHGMRKSDEPWSRPGVYVLFRALTDLICVSSTCPDDTSPANGWYLSDIHVRTYSGAEKFQRAVASRTTPDAKPKMTKDTGFHAKISALTRSDRCVRSRHRLYRAAEIQDP